MKQIEDLLNQYKNKELDSFNFQKNIFQIYRNSERTEELKKEVMDLIAQSSTLDLRFDMWRVFFESDREITKRINIQEARNLAEESLSDYLKEPHPTLLKTIVSTVYISCSRDELNYNFDQENVWLQVFSAIPQFALKLKEEKQYWLDRNAKNHEQYKHLFITQEEIKSRPIVDSYEIFVPVQPSSSKDVMETPEMQMLISEILKQFDEMGLEGYMDCFKNKCSGSSASYSNGISFRFDCYEALNKDELVAAKNEFLGQLSEGWGESASQRKILIGSEEVSLNFILGESSDFKVSEKKKKRLSSQF